jgi:D-glycero-D-manno-heptose 1,7-bisphosphate phosphatase
VEGAGHSRAVFLDRDGVLNELVIRDGAAVSPRRVEDFRICDGAQQAVQRLRELGVRIFVASNQPDVARGFLAPSELERMTEILTRSLPIDEVAICPHDDADDCACRKPRPGMLVAMADRWNVGLSESFVIGDSWKDIEAGKRAGCRTVLLRRAPSAPIAADHEVADLSGAITAVESILRERGD